MLFTAINLMYIVAHLLLIGVAVYFWRRYPRPSLYLASMAALELMGSVLQSGVMMLLNWGSLASQNVLLIQAFASLIRFGAHVLAMVCLVMAVYVARRPRSSASSGNSLPAGTPGMEGQDQAQILDATNPYAPSRQHR
jgi:hypothetical protein